MSFQKLMNFAELKKTDINYSLKTRNEEKVDQKNKSDPHKVRSNVTNRAHYQGDKHSCRDSKECKPEWDILGCVEFYRLAKIQERKDFCKENYFCLRCGGKFPFNKPNTSKKDRKSHTCKWNNSKDAARC